MRYKNEIQVGFTVLIAAGILIWSLAWLKDYSLERSKQVWTVEFPETGGLAPSDEVLVNGIRKGQVKSIELVGDRVRIELSLDKRIVLTSDSRIAIRNVGLMGEKVIGVDLKSTGTPYSPDRIIAGEYEMGMSEVLGQMGGMMDHFANLSRDLEEVARLLARDGGLNQTVRNFSHTSEELRLTVSENRAKLQAAIGDFAEVARTAKSLTTDREEQLRQTIDSFASAADKMEQLTVRLDSLRAVIQSVSGKVDRGEGTLGRLVQDEKLYADLNGSVKSLRELIEDIKAHPKKYLKFSIF